MGRDVAGLRIDKKPSLINDVKTNGTFHGAVHVAPKATPEEVETHDHELEEHTMKGRLPDEHNEKQDVFKSTNREPEEKIIRAETPRSIDKKLSSPLKLASVSIFNESGANSSEPGTPVEKKTRSTDHASMVESNDSGLKSLAISDDPVSSPRTEKEPEKNAFPLEENVIPPSSPPMSGKQLQLNEKKYYKEEDNWSLASSTATSRTSKFRITVPVAPRFTCAERLERRKQFYTKLEEKHKALERERLEYEARTKEEEESAIRQLRKSMVVKANPVPSFYREGPPPKPELKKLPVTRAKSPNLTRRKSCGDATKSSPEDKGHSARVTRHSVGVYKDSKSSPVAPKSKDRTGVRKSNGTIRGKDRPQPLKETTENSQVQDQGVDNAVES